MLCLTQWAEHPHAARAKLVRENARVSAAVDANLESVAGAPLTAQDMRAIAGIDRNCRLIKGQVFLWKADQRWEDLWDLDGVIRE